MAGNDEQFLGETVVITGSSRGIGRATAIEFGSRGADVVVNYRSNEAAAAEVVEEIEAVHPEATATAVQADLSRTDGVDALFDAVDEEFGRIDVFVHNAAVTAFKPLADVSREEIDLTFDLSVHGFVLSVQRAVELMDEGGRIVSISGIDATYAMPGHGLLGAAKAALEELTKYVAAEHGEDGIRANSINVGVSRTDSSEYYATTSEDAQEFMDMLVDQTPLGEITPPESIATAVTMLCSEDSHDVSGQVLHVDSGLTARL
ncbi:SDR family oxidoreductase [Natronomonas marina]|jgi:NAD(P)-dependent dehydrogenase (short-subunit alcohol dehydrogenase family)|uniref:SDR family oxidoreductase n=1 Tax=Natronomonas marina TaxID=2961939 RepID=UPI0020C9D3D9|nr:SDR family oxidoreductase [Natronomonas marina]